MKVLHIYPKSDDLILRHVTLLAEGMRHSAEIHVTDSAKAFRQFLHEVHPDIVHCHGCWHYPIVRSANSARRYGARIVITPHGQLEPWIIKQQGTREKVCKTLLWQKEAIRRAYSVITLGKLERNNFEKFKWSNRVEEIHNAVTTNSITAAEMCAQTFAIYQKVMDSNTLELMDSYSLQTLARIIKAGITGDRRWIAGQAIPPLPSSPETPDAEGMSTENWRRLFLYAEHENIRNYIDYGINILGMKTPLIDTTRIPAYFPPTYTRPRPVKELAGDYMGNETDYLLRIIHQISKAPQLLHLIELTRELYRDTVNDDQLTELLGDKKLKDFAARLMQVLREQTLLDEGYMPLIPIDDRQTKHIRKLLKNHLKI